MKKLLFSLLVLILPSIGCLAQDDNHKVFDEKSGKDILLGAVTRDGLIGMGDWFDLAYNEYKPDSATIAALKESKDQYPYIFVVMATWCGDSREQVPHFYKIMDMLDYPKEQIFVVAVDRDKKAGNFCIGDFNVKLVPTFIFTIDGEETGRIIETPVNSLERDLLDIFTGKQPAPGQ